METGIVTQVAPQDAPAISVGLAEVVRVGAIQNPRNEAMAQEKAIQELELVPELANRSYYAIPYNQGKKNEKMVMGLTIGAMMSLTRHWKHIITAGKFSSEDDDSVYVDGLCLDVQDNILRVLPYKVSKFYTPHGTARSSPLDQTMLRNASHAGISKAIRNASERVLPEWYRQSYFEAAKQLVIRPKAKGQVTKSIQERVSDGRKLIISKFKITPKELEWHLTNHADSLPGDDEILVHITGLYNTLQGGISNSEMRRLFGREQEVPMSPKQKKAVS